MILYLDTSTPLAQLWLVNGDDTTKKEWQADRNLAHGLLKFIKDSLSELNLDWADIKAIGVFEGPGSFTGLRIGLTVANTLADSLSIPIVGAKSEGWRAEAKRRLNDGQNDKVVMPFYGAGANITKPRK